jgi:hypothetical protein
MKLLPKILLLLFGLSIFLITLYNCIPTIPKQVKHTYDGNTYTFRNFSFDMEDQTLQEWTEVMDKITGEGVKKENIKVWINNYNTTRLITLVDNSDSLEIFDALSNPFKHRSLVREYNSTTINELEKYTIYEITDKPIRSDFKLYKKDSLLFLITTTLHQNNNISYDMSMRIGNQSYTFLYQGENQKENLFKIMQTIKLN